MRTISIVALLTVFATGSAFAQQHRDPHAMPHEHRAHAGPVSSEPRGAFAVRSFGAFRNMVQKSDFTPKILLGDAKGLGITEAVGAVSGLRGEITAIGGRLIVSYGGGCTNCPAPHTETAALLGTGRVAQWSTPLALPADLEGRDLDAFIIETAKKAGLDLTQPFPVRLTGTLINVAMHVIEAPRDGFTGHGSQVPMAKQDEYKHAALAGDVVGLYAPKDMRGVLSHPGEPFHFHWVDEQRTRTAHLDSFGMKAGSSLLLPVK
jgi:hypothetical protein